LITNHLRTNTLEAKSREQNFKHVENTHYE